MNKTHPVSALASRVLNLTRFTRLRLLSLAWLCALYAVGCKDSAAPVHSTTVVRLRVSVEGDIKNAGITPGGFIGVSVAAMNAQGDSLPGTYAVDLVSRDTTVATIDASHFVHGIRNGQTYIVGSLLWNGSLFTDSMHVSVSIPNSTNDESAAPSLPLTPPAAR